MVEIKNNGKKLVHIGKQQVMPGESITVADKVADTPAIKVFAKRNILSLSEVKETVAAAEEKGADSDTATAGQESADGATAEKAKSTTKKTTASVKASK